MSLGEVITLYMLGLTSVGLLTGDVNMIVSSIVALSMLLLLREIVRLWNSLYKEK